jgi:ferredoxin
VADEEDAVIKNFDREGAVEVSIPTGHLRSMFLAKPLFEADFVINLPKLKTHSAGIYTGAVKNLFGCIPGLKKAEYHRLAPDPQDLGHIIADIHQGIKVGLHIMDGVTAMQGEGPTAGDIYHAGKILFSSDALALDTVATAMLGMTVDDVPILVSARERKLGEGVLPSIKLAGDYTNPPHLPGFKFPKRFRSSKQRNYKVLVKLIDFLKTRPQINAKLCRHCNMCIESCPVQAIDCVSKRIDYGKCIECMCCHELCMHQAVILKRQNRLAAIFTYLYRGNYK